VEAFGDLSGSLPVFGSFSVYSIATKRLADAPSSAYKLKKFISKMVYQVPVWVDLGTNHPGYARFR
jgi:hypothetical protein